jgi:hypothetical protein
MTNLLDIIRRLILIKTHNVSETEVSPSSGKRHLLGPIDRASPISGVYLMTETDSSLRNVVCFNQD